MPLLTRTTLNRDERNIPDSRDREAQAAVWLARRDRGLTPGEQDIFFEWLAADPKNGECFARHQQLWSRLNSVADWRPEHAEHPNHELLAAPGKHRKFPMLAVGLGLAASITLGLFVGRHGRSVQPDAQSAAAIASAVEERRLADGSLVQINKGTDIDVEFTASLRQVRLLRGEAFFTVSKDPARPFVVVAGRFEARAIGTAFNVRLGAEAVEVLVTQGKVQLNETLNHQPAATKPVREGPVIAANHRAVIGRVGQRPPQITSVSAAEITRLLSWQSKRLEFIDAPLSSIVAEFNRYNQVQLVIKDRELAELSIGTSFGSDNVEGFVRILESSFGVRADRSGNTITLRRAKE
jgi:transmembrane sensor